MHLGVEKFKLSLALGCSCFLLVSLVIVDVDGVVVLLSNSGVHHVLIIYGLLLLLLLENIGYGFVFGSCLFVKLRSATGSIDDVSFNATLLVSALLGGWFTLGFALLIRLGDSGRFADAALWRRAFCNLCCFVNEVEVAGPGAVDGLWHECLRESCGCLENIFCNIIRQFRVGSEAIYWICWAKIRWMVFVCLLHVFELDW